MSEVLPYEENISHYGDDGAEEQISLTCRLQNNSSNFFSSGQNKRAPKLGQIGRSKRGGETTYLRCVAGEIKLCWFSSLKTHSLFILSYSEKKMSSLKKIESTWCLHFTITMNIYDAMP